MVDGSLVLKEASDVESFLENPTGYFITRPGFTYWYPWSGFTGFALVGRPSVTEIRELNRLMDVVLPPRATSHVSIIDTTRLERVDRDAFATMHDYLDARKDAFTGLIQRQALVRPSGMVGALVAGFYQVVAARYPVEIFESLIDAVAWLGVPRPLELAQALLEFTQQQQGHPDGVLLQLRDHFSENLPKLAPLKQSAKRRSTSVLKQSAITLAMSKRTLQRRLNRCGTSFQAELNAAQIRLAMELMLDSTLSLTEIAYRIRCSSPAHFSSMFRKLTGKAPSTWRQQASVGRLRSNGDGTPQQDSPR